METLMEMFNKEVYKDLIGLLNEGESIYALMQSYPLGPIYFIGPAGEHEADGETDFRNDIAECIEDTLHRLLEAGLDPADSLNAFPATDEDLEEDEYGDLPEGIWYIDLDYVIRDFSPVFVYWVMDAEKSEEVEEEIAEEAEVA